MFGLKADAKKIMFRLYVFILAALFVMSVSFLILNYWEGSCAARDYQSLREDVLTKRFTAPDKRGEMEEILPVVAEKRLIEINPAYAAWLYLPESLINYPVVFPETNQEYLKKSFEGVSQSCGSLFFDAKTEPMTSLNTIIHGHNMKDKTMFGTLKEFLKGEYGKEHDLLYLNWNGKWKTYQLFAVYLVGNTDPFPYRTVFLSQDEFKKYLNESLEKSSYHTELSAETVETLLTLSTCYGKKEKLILQWAEMEWSI